MTRWLAVLLTGLIWSNGTVGATQENSIDSSSCLHCHREKHPALVAAWEKSRHNLPDLDCRSCHGSEHDGQMADRSRRNEACTGCHDRENKSYSISKHGVIATLEAQRLDFSLPLREGNQRAPSCAYCHLHQGSHAIGAEILPLLPKIGCQEVSVAAKHAEARTFPCLDCHSPRFVETWFASGDRMVEIGRMKVCEAEEVLHKITATEATQRARTLYTRMTESHLSNVRLGVGHQSPDDQWWHGQPALDGDLLRIKSILSE
jgi:hypothetical protein